MTGREKGITPCWQPGKKNKRHKGTEAQRKIKDERLKKRFMVSILV